MGKERGLDGFRFYFLGRGGVMGDVEPAVVVSALGYFNPSLVEKMWTTARQKVAPPEAATLYLECCRQFGRDRLGGVKDLDVFCAAAEAIVDAVDPAGFTLYAAIAEAPLPDDAPGRAMQLIAVLRELRGSAHLVAVRAAGLSAEVAHYLRRPNDYTSFGWGDTPAGGHRRRPGPAGQGRRAHRRSRAARLRGRRRRHRRDGRAGADGHRGGHRVVGLKQRRDLTPAEGTAPRGR